MIRNIFSSKGNLLTSETQMPDASKRSKKQLVIGLDFGTAFTKVVIGETRHALAVHFSRYSGGNNPYLIPTAMAVDSSGLCHLDLGNPKNQLVDNLKMQLLDGDYSVELQAEIVAYMALVLQYTRKWLFTKHKKVYGKSHLDWYMNVGLPTQDYHNGKMVDAYKKMAHSAWIVSVFSREVSIDLAKDVLSGEVDLEGISDQIIDEEAVALFPEFAAQIAGYVKSPQRQDDLHVLMDVGAGTVDLTVFNVTKKKGEDFFPIFAKSVMTLGVFFLAKHRMNASGYKGRWRPSPREPALPDKEFAKKIGISIREMRLLDKGFREKLTKQLTSQLSTTKKKKYPESPKWELGVPIFLCGGGSHVELYSDLVDLMVSQGKPYKLEKQILPRPDKLQASRLSADKFDRLSVAYGLSFDAFDIGEIEKENRGQDIRPKSATPTKKKGEFELCKYCQGGGGFRGNDCPRCGGRGW